MIWINDVKIKDPEVSLESYNLTKSGRTAAGLMMMDLIAKKKKLNVSYPVLSGKDLNDIKALIDSNQMFFKVRYDLPEGSGIMTCYAGAIKATYFRRSGGWYWKDVSFALIEQ